MLRLAAGSNVVCEYSASRVVSREERQAQQAIADFPLGGQLARPRTFGREVRVVDELRVGRRRGAVQLGHGGHAHGAPGRGLEHQVGLRLVRQRRLGREDCSLRDGYCSELVGENTVTPSSARHSSARSPRTVFQSGAKVHASCANTLSAGSCRRRCWPARPARRRSSCRESRTSGSAACSRPAGRRSRRCGRHRAPQAARCPCAARLRPAGAVAVGQRPRAARQPPPAARWRAVLPLLVLAIVVQTGSELPVQHAPRVALEREAVHHMAQVFAGCREVARRSTVRTPRPSMLIAPP